MNFGLKIWSINVDNYLKEAVRLYETGKCDYVELYAVPGSRSTLKEWKSTGLPFTIHCPHSFHGFNLADGGKKSSNMQLFDEARIFADELDADYIVVHGGVEGSIYETAKQFKSLKDSRAVLENKPFRAIPNNMGFNFCRGYCPEEVKIVMEEAGCGFCLDFVHAVCAANSLRKPIYDYVESFAALKPTMFHLSNMPDPGSEYDSHIHLADGKLDLLRLMFSVPANGKVSLETEKSFKNSLADFDADSSCIKKIINKI